MQTPQLILLILQAALFLPWVFMMFRMLWKISRNAGALNTPTDGFAAQTGNRMNAFTGFFRDPANRRFLIVLLVLSVLLMAVNVLGFMLFAPDVTSQARS